jgi:hypothetical protein
VRIALCAMRETDIARLVEALQAGVRAAEGE